MIKVIKKDNVIRITGHANYSESGKDIVCASVSSIILTTVNSIMNIDKDSIEYIDDGNIIEIRLLKNDDVINKLINTMILLLEDLSRQYKKNIKVESEE